MVQWNGDRPIVRKFNDWALGLGQVGLVSVNLLTNSWTIKLSDYRHGIRWYTISSYYRNCRRKLWRCKITRSIATQSLYPTSWLHASAPDSCCNSTCQGRLLAVDIRELPIHYMQPWQLRCDIGCLSSWMVTTCKLNRHDRHDWQLDQALSTCSVCHC